MFIEEEMKANEILDEIDSSWEDSDLGEVRHCIDEFTQFDGEF